MSKHKCKVCGDGTHYYYYEDETNKDLTGCYCENCYFEEFRECCECGREEHKSLLFKQGDNYYCQICYNYEFKEQIRFDHFCNKKED